MMRASLSHVFLACACGALTLLVGCASASPDHDARFGQAAHVLAVQQRLNPDASRQNEGKALGADGRTVNASTGKMMETYRNPPKAEPQSIGTVGVGTTTTSGR